MKTLDCKETWNGRNAPDNARGHETADLAYLHERWPGASEDVLRAALDLLNSESIAGQ